MDGRGYMPRYMMATRPLGKDVYEVVVAGNDSVGILSKIASVMAENNVNLLSSHGQTDESGSRFVNAFFCDLGKATSSPEALQKELLSLPSVDEVLVSHMGRAMYEKFMFPLSTFNGGRALLADAAAFQMIEERLVELFGTAGSTMLFEQGKAYAKKYMADMEAYRRKIGTGWDIENIEGCLRGQGWGAVSIREQPGGYWVSVESPAVHPSGAPRGELNRFTLGLIVGMLEVLARGPLRTGAMEFDTETQSFTFTVNASKRAA